MIKSCCQCCQRGVLLAVARTPRPRKARKVRVASVANDPQNLETPLTLERVRLRIRCCQMLPRLMFWRLKLGKVPKN